MLLRDRREDVREGQREKEQRIDPVEAPLKILTERQRNRSAFGGVTDDETREDEEDDDRFRAEREERANARVLEDAPVIKNQIRSGDTTDRIELPDVPRVKR